ncbi:MAG: A/G-specific adenine glycosylase [Lautropia sp.]
MSAAPRRRTAIAAGGAAVGTAAVGIAAVGTAAAASAAEADCAASPATTDLAAEIIGWQRVHGRHTLPWQRSVAAGTALRDPYRVWLSEVMLQQTQVAAVIPYFEAFVAAFPDVAALAAAPADRVMALWSGLGYYSRARNLHAAARCVVERHGGAFPATAEALAELPGVGRSTAAAIAVFGFGARAAILDGNVKRVFARVFAVEGFPGDTAVARRLWQHSEAELPGPESSASERIAYTQGLMDLGATVCSRGRPACRRCPLAGRCAALRLDAVARFPAPRPRRVLPVRSVDLLLQIEGDRVLLEQRPPAGIWGGLWSLPELAPASASTPASASASASASAPRSAAATVAAGMPPRSGLVCHGRFGHVFTHFRMDATVWRGDAAAVPAAAAAAGVREPRPTRWLALAEAAGAPLPQPIKRLLTGLAAGDLASP